jgi:(E)-4-hydroxy-3-methylbut-2-enyl-diphosphate synthase
MRFEPGLAAYRRRRTRVVHVGDVPLGGDHPIRVQSMTTPATTDTAATVAQIARLVEAGCEIVRVTVPTSNDADNLPNIRAELSRRSIRVPLAADIHFTPAAAMKAVEHVEKIRVNPGNFADKKRFAVREYTDAEYAAELERIEKVFSPLVRRCRALGVAMRIGTNHGSLSDRILNRFGDTPEGMVESALEFVAICEAHGYRDLVISMKASNPKVVLEAYRLLARRMDAEGRDYPLHLGVTEAGDGEDGRIKSAIGMGALLEEGLGDTVRVSLTEDPVAEIPVAFALVAPYNRAIPRPEPEPTPAIVSPPPRSGTVKVEVPLRSPLTDVEALRREIDGEAGVRVPEDTRADVVSVAAGSWSDVSNAARLRSSLELVAPRLRLSVRVPSSLVEGADAPALDSLSRSAHRIHVNATAPLPAAAIAALLALTKRTTVLVEVGGRVDAALDLALSVARAGGDISLAMDPSLDVGPLFANRALAARLIGAGLRVPHVLIDRPALRGADPVLGPAAHLGGLLCEGIGDAIHVEAGDAGASRRLGFNILQGARVRITKTEFISCPSCGRTLFDLESTTARIKERTAHLKGLKIAVMGCVVNGPGEMADADFGYVGWGDEKIALFVGKEMVEKDIPTGEAADRLVDLIKRHGKWVEPQEPAPSAP